MRIIGFGELESTLVQVSKDELAQLAGFARIFSATGPLKDGAKVGMNVPLGSIYEDAKDALNNHRDAQSAAIALRKAADKFLKYFIVEKENNG